MKHLLQSTASRLEADSSLAVLARYHNKAKDSALFPRNIDNLTKVGKYLQSLIGDYLHLNRRLDVTQKTRGLAKTLEETYVSLPDMQKLAAGWASGKDQEGYNEVLSRIETNYVDTKPGAKSARLGDIACRVMVPAMSVPKGTAKEDFQIESKDRGLRVCVEDLVSSSLTKVR